MSPRIKKCTLALVTRDQAELLDIFLKNYVEWGKHWIHLLVIDDGSRDATSDILQQYQQTHGIRFQRQSPSGAACARNHALRICETPWIAFSDTDCILNEDYYPSLATALETHKDEKAFEGAVDAPNTPIPYMSHWLHNPKGGCFATANMVFQIDAVQKVGGFDENYPSNLREDSDLALSLLENGIQIPFEKNLRIVHPYIPRIFSREISKAFHRQKDIVRAELKLYAKHPRLYPRLRRHHSASGTLFSLALKHAWLFSKISFPWLKQEASKGLLPGIYALAKASQALFLSCYEQASLAIHFLTSSAKRPFQVQNQEAIHSSSPMNNKPKLLWAWIGAGRKEWQSPFEMLLQDFDIKVVAPKSWTHGSVAIQSDTGASPVEVTPWWSLGNGRYLLPYWPWIVATFRPQIIVFMDEPDRLALAIHLAIASILRPKCRRYAYALQTLPHPAYYRFWHRLALKLNRRLLHGSLAATPNAENVLRLHGFKKPMDIAPLYVDSNRFHIPEASTKQLSRKKLGVDDNVFVILYVGTLSKSKGVEYLFQAMEGQTRFTLFVASGNQPSPFIKEKYQGSNIKWLGPLEGDDLISLYHAGDCIVLPSLSTEAWEEQIGRVLLEGVFCGCLGLSSDSGVLPWVLHDSRFLFKQADAQALKDCLMAFSQMPHQEREDLQSQQREWIQQNFSDGSFYRITRDYLMREIHAHD